MQPVVISVLTTGIITPSNSALDCYANLTLYPVTCSTYESHHQDNFVKILNCKFQS